MTTISGLFRYPVKSLGGEPLEKARLEARGLEGDRRYAFLDSAPNRAGKLLTARQLNSMLTYRAALQPGQELHPEVVVSAPDGSVHEVTAVALRERLEAELGRPLTLRDAAGENFDDSPVLLLNLASVRRFAAAAGRDLDPRRFRANVLLEGMEPDAEYGWVGHRIRVGDAVLEGTLMCERCVMITYDPDTTESDRGILRTLNETRRGLLGIYCRVLEPGVARLGDPVEAIC